MSFSVDAFLADWLLFFQSQFDNLNGQFGWLVEHPLAQLIGLALATVVGYDLIKKSCRMIANTFQLKRISIFWLTSRMIKRMGWMALFPPYWTGIVITALCDLVLLPFEIICCFGLRTSLRDKISNVVSSLGRLLSYFHPFESANKRAIKRQSLRLNDLADSEVYDADCDECDRIADEIDNEPKVESVGKIVEHHGNGQIAIQADVVYMDNGSWHYHGRHTTFHDNGRVNETGTYNMGNPVNIAKFDKYGKKR